jgi:acyl-CoA reductase-like NAD-dependent aldehyde dehydrogenase
MRQADKVDEVRPPFPNLRSAEDQHVQDAVSKGAKILVGGKRGERTAYYPTILTDVTQDCVRLPQVSYIL